MCRVSAYIVVRTISRRVVGQIVRLWALANEEFSTAHTSRRFVACELCVVRVEPQITKGTTLAQEVPALIQFDLDLREALTIGLGKFPLVVQSSHIDDDTRKSFSPSGSSGLRPSTH